mgnify:CR=1 FL=1
MTVGGGRRVWGILWSKVGPSVYWHRLGAAHHAACRVARVLPDGLGVLALPLRRRGVSHEPIGRRGGVRTAGAGAATGAAHALDDPAF